MNVTIVDYNSGNISSVINSFQEVAKDKVNIEVTSDLNKIKSSDKIVLPGQGSFKSCVDALNSIDGLVDTLNDYVTGKKKPSPKIFKYALNLIDDLAENCLMIGDNFIADISGAKNVGMNAIHFNSNNEEYHDICPIIYSYDNIYELINKF